MPLVQRHNLYRKVYVGGKLHPLIQIATQAGSALLPSFGKSHIKKILSGVLSSAASALLFKGLQHGSKYIQNSMTNKLNQGGFAASAINKLLGLSDPTADGMSSVNAIDREMLPLKNQLMANTADINITAAPLREVMKTISPLVKPSYQLPESINPGGYGMYQKPKNMQQSVMKSNMNKAINKRADMLLRNMIK